MGPRCWRMIQVCNSRNYQLGVLSFATADLPDKSQHDLASNSFAAKRSEQPVLLIFWDLPLTCQKTTVSASFVGFRPTDQLGFGRFLQDR